LIELGEILLNRLEQATYETLNSSDAPLHVRDICMGVKQRVPDLCDDSILPCTYCKQKHPLWQHKVMWALQKLKHRGLVESPRRGYWKVKEPVQLEREAAPVASIVEPKPAESLHEVLKYKIKEIGEILGKQTHTEFPTPPYVYDVVWKEIEALLPSHVFEIQDKGSVNGALSKLQHARDVWRAKLFLVVTGERDRAKVDLLLRPLWQGAFHKISGQTLVLTPDEIEDVHRVLSSYRDVIRRFTQE
jgi:hypothetical protein